MPSLPVAAGGFFVNSSRQNAFMVKHYQFVKPAADLQDLVMTGAPRGQSNHFGAQVLYFQKQFFTSHGITFAGGMISYSAE